MGRGAEIDRNVVSVLVEDGGMLWGDGERKGQGLGRKNAGKK